jgi:hypothetical protein
MAEPKPVDQIARAAVRLKALADKAIRHFTKGRL